MATPNRSTLHQMSPNVYPTFTTPGFNYNLYAKLNDTHTFSPSVLNEAHISFVRAYGHPVCDPCDIPGTTVIGMTAFGNSFGPGVFVQNNVEFRDVVAFNRGSHSMKTGITLQALYASAVMIFSACSTSRFEEPPGFVCS